MAVSDIPEQSWKAILSASVMYIESSYTNMLDLPVIKRIIHSSKIK